MVGNRARNCTIMNKICETKRLSNAFRFGWIRFDGFIFAIHKNDRLENGLTWIVLNSTINDSSTRNSGTFSLLSLLWLLLTLAFLFREWKNEKQKCQREYRFQVSQIYWTVNHVFWPSFLSFRICRWMSINKGRRNIYIAAMQALHLSIYKSESGHNGKC